MSELLALPTSPLLTEARAVLESVAPSPLVAHSVRTFLLGRAYGRKRKVAVDEEALFAAALLHDLGLCPARRDRSRPFTKVSGEVLAGLAQTHGFDPKRISAMTTAIDFHMRPLPSWKHGAVAGLLQVGAWMDLLLVRRWSVRAEARLIDARYPKKGLFACALRGFAGSIGSVESCTGLLFPKDA